MPQRYEFKLSDEETLNRDDLRFGGSVSTRTLRQSTARAEAYGLGSVVFIALRDVESFAARPARLGCGAYFGKGLL